MSNAQRIFAVLLASVCGSSDLYAQILYGSIVGNVKDQSDAAVGGATVVATHKETNQSRTATSRGARRESWVQGLGIEFMGLVLRLPLP